MKKFAFLAPLIAVVLAGCAHDPTIAAKVDGQSIPISDVTIFAKVICATNAAQAAQPGAPQGVEPLSAINQLALVYLAGAKAVEAQVSASNRPLQTSSGAGADVIATLPAPDRSRAQHLLDEVIGAMKDTGAPSPAEALPKLYEAIQAEMSRGAVVTNPAYAIPDSSADIASGSISQAISGSAKASSTGAASYTAGLPASQKCG